MPSEESLLAHIKALAGNFQHLCPRECREVVADLLERAVEFAEDLTVDLCKAILTFTLSIVAPRCTEHRPLQWASLGLLSATGQAARASDGANRAELHSFFFKLAKKEAKRQLVWKPRVMVPMLQFVLRFVTAISLAKAPAEGEGACALEVMTTFMQSLYSELAGGRSEKWSRRWWGKALRALQKVFRAFPPALDHAVASMRKEEPPALLVAAVGHCVAAQGESSEHRAALVELYSKYMLEAKQPASDAALNAWAPVVSIIKPEEFEKQLLPLALRMSKRQPVPTHHCVPALLSQLTIDLSPCAKEVLDPLAVEILKVPERRPRGRLLVQEVVRKATDLAASAAVADTWSEGLKKAGKTDEKQAALAGIGALVAALPGAQTTGRACDDVLRRLADPKGQVCKMAMEDANEESRSLACRVLGALLLQLPADAGDTELLKVLSDKKAVDRVKNAALECLADAVGSGAGAGVSWGASALDKVAPLLAVAATKPVQRPQSLLAWAICGSLASAQGEKLAALLKKEQIGLLKDASSFLNAPAIVLRAPKAETLALAQLWRAVLAGHVTGVPAFSTLTKAPKGAGSVEEAGTLPPVAWWDLAAVPRTTVVLLACLHGGGISKEAAAGGREAGPAPSERLGLCEAMKTLPEAEAQALGVALVHSLVAWLAELSPMVPKARQVGAAPLRGVLIDICTALSASDSAPPPEVLALLMLAVHHPVLATREWPTARLWKWLRSKGPLAAALQRVPEAWQALRQLVGQAFRLPASELSGLRRAAVEAVACSFDVGAVESGSAQKGILREAVTSLIGQCGQSLHADEVGKEKEHNVSIFFAPEGRLWMEEGTYMAAEVEEKNLKKNKYLKGYGDDDLDLVVEKAVPKATPKTSGKAKSKAGAKAGAASKASNAGALNKLEIEAERLKEQSETRARIRSYVDEAHFALATLAALARAGTANAELLQAAVPDLVAQFVVLMGSPLTVLATRGCLRDLVGLVVSPGEVGRKDLLPDALQVVAKGWMARTPSAAGTAGDEPACEAVLESVSMGNPLPPVTLSLVLPVALRPLMHSTTAIGDLCQKALHFLDQQLQLGAEIPESSAKDVFEALSTALLALPGQRLATQAAMLAAGKHLISTEEELHSFADLFFSEDDLVRSSVIGALAEVPQNEHFLEERLDAKACRAVLRLAALDEQTTEIADRTIQALDLEADGDLVRELIDFAEKKMNLSQELQTLIANATADVLKELEDATASNEALDMLMALFRQESATRPTVARCLEAIFKGSLQGEEQVTKAFKFLLRQALGITNGTTPELIELRDILLAAGVGLIEKQGEEHADVLFACVEDFEDSGAGTAAGESARLGVAVFLGALSKHLGAEHPKVPEILPRLLQRLLDPSSTVSVQNAIVKVMPPLMKQNKDQATEQLGQLLQTAVEAKTHKTTRRGAAMGLGATVKGLSIQVVSQHGIIKKIEVASEDKDAGVREGAMMCLEGLTLSLGKLFDPYVVASLPLVQKAFSDSSIPVREASQSAAKAMMSQLSGPGVKQVLKPLLDGIKDKQWRTKLGSIELLAAMTNCVPKQLTACLPQVVPALCVVINDQHAKVKAAAGEALERIGNIITSPELRALAPELIEALTDGAQYEDITKRVLDQLLSTSFVHHIDAPSLSLVCPLVQRALKERSAEMKRKGAQIVGSMVLLIRDPKDIQPYLPLLLPQLKVTLVDPIPDVRATAAKAFGTLANGLPEEMLGDVLPWLFEMLRSSESAVERSGAAHGLSEVLMAMGTERIEKLLPDILSNASNKDASPEVKEGYIGLFVYLPVAMGKDFEPYLEDVLTTLLNGISDDTSSVRDTAFKAAQVLVKTFGASHTSKLLSPLEEGVFAGDWRIRHASVTLMGQLIEMILKAHRIPTTNAELMQCDVLPKEWRSHMLASLYIVRSDENGNVKQECARVWKACVQNTARTLRELLPTLMKRLIANLASTNREKQKMAARCVGDLVGKLGERVMPELMPIFMNTLTTGDAHVREGVCIGLAELINATTKQLLADYIGDLIPAIRQAIIDDESTVRNAASTVVALLHNAVGQKATTDVVTWVLAQLCDPELEEHGHVYLHGLEQLMSKQPGEVLKIVLDRLSVPSDEGWTKFQVLGLASIAVVPDSHTVSRHLSDVLPVLVDVAGSDESGPELREVALEAASKVMDRVEEDGLNLLFAELIKAVEDHSAAMRRVAGAQLIEAFFEQTGLDVVPMLPQVLPAILPVALDDESDEALKVGVRALSAIMKKVKKEDLAPYLSEVREAILRLVTNLTTRREDMSKLLPGLCNHGGLEPLYPIYQHGLMNGSADARELAAKGLGELVNHTTEQALKPYVVKITGPLIRIVGDRFPGTVKKAIVDTLKALLVKGGATLKPFLPQLQTTYVKCLADPTEDVRQGAAESLGSLARLSARTEPLINELVGGVSHADPGVRLAMCRALGEVMQNVPQPASEAVQEKLLDALLPLALGGEDGGSPRERELAAFALAMVMRRHLPTDRAVTLLQEEVVGTLVSSNHEPQRRAAAARTLAGICWCREPPLQRAGLGELLGQLVPEWLPRLLGDASEPLVVSGATLLSGAARLAASAPEDFIAFSALTPSVTKLSGLLTGGKVQARALLLAARHIGAAAQEAGAASDAALTQLATAAAGRGGDSLEATAQCAADGGFAWDF